MLTCRWCSDRPLPGGEPCPFCGPDATAETARAAEAARLSGTAAAFCSECGAALAGSRRFCSVCGSPVGTPGGPAAPAAAEARGRGSSVAGSGVAAPYGTPVLVSPPAGPRGSKPRVDNTYAWALATVPVVMLAVAAPLALMGVGAAEWVAAAVGLALNVLFVVRDEDRLEEAGIRCWGFVWAVLLVPVYLVVRTAKVAGAVFIPIAWVVAVALYMVGSMVVGERVPVELDPEVLETAIDEWLDENSVGGRADCPDDVSVRVGATFLCEVSGGPASLVEVTLTDLAGSVTWQVVG